MSGDKSVLPELRQDVASGRDAYVAGRDINIHLPAQVPTPPVVRGWGNVPARNPGFTGREEQIEAIRAAVLGTNPAAVQALHGMGGVGKTQLAIEYAHRFADGYDVVWWLDAGNAVLFGQQFADLATALGCAEPGAPQDVVRRAVLSDLHRRPRWLIIFDNAEHPGDLRDWLPNGPGHVLITSRSAAWSELAVPVPVGVLTRAESVQLLRSRVPSLPASDADMLAAALGDLPLAIAQAAAYLAETWLPATDYVSLLENQAAELLSEGKPATYGTTLTAVTTLTYDRLRRTDEAVADLAAICAFLAPEPIPVDWFTTAAVCLPGRLAASLAGPLARSRLLASLTRTSLARLDDGLTMHRLTQAILRTSLQPPEHAITRALAEAVVIASAPGDPGLPTSWSAWSRLLPHLLALNPGLSDNSILRSVSASAAWYLAVSGNAKDALVLATHLYEQWRARLGFDDVQTLAIANTLGQALRILGYYDRARQLDTDSLARNRRLRGDDDPATLMSASNLAVDLSELNNYQAARALDEDTLARRRRVLGEDHIHTLMSANNLANCLRDLGEHHAARALDEDTFARYRRILGEDHPDTLRSAQNLAVGMRCLGDYQAARALQEDTLARRRRVLGEDHIHTLRTANNLATDLRALGDYYAARALDEDTLARCRLVLGEEHPHTRRSVQNLARDLVQILARDLRALAEAKSSAPQSSSGGSKARTTRTSSGTTTRRPAPTGQKNVSSGLCERQSTGW